MRGFMLSLAVILSTFHFAFAAPEEALSVERFMREADAGGGKAAVIGLVCKADAKAGRFGLADAKKFGCCDKPENCVSGVLPVRWKGPLPRDGQMVRVRGSVAREEGRLVFVGEDVKVIEASAK